MRQISKNQVQRTHMIWFILNAAELINFGILEKFSELCLPSCDHTSIHQENIHVSLHSCIFLINERSLNKWLFLRISNGYSHHKKSDLKNIFEFKIAYES